MKKIITLCLAALLLLTSLPLTACQTEAPKEETPTSLVLVKDSISEFKIVRSNGASRTSPEREAVLVVRDAIKTSAGVELARETDTYNKNDPEATAAVESAKEILVGQTNRKETAQALEGLQPQEYIIKVIGNKLVITGACEEGTLAAAEYFAANCLTAGATVELPWDYEVKGVLDMQFSETHNMTYEQMGNAIIEAYASTYINRAGKLTGTEFWDTAEIFEAMLDAYEQTENPKYLTYAENIAIKHFDASNANKNHLNNMFNDDLAWMIIGLTRLYNFTGKQEYLRVAKNNFDQMWKRAYSPDVLDGGLWWKHDQQNTKNSCIQCPASIAACHLAKALKDDSYYEKAKITMEWEFEHLFNEKNGQVYDAINTTNGNVSQWASTYNQGTFVGACIMLHEKYGDQKYLDYAAKAVSYGMYSLENVDGVLNGEAAGNDLIGFKGILTRWFYRYAKYTGDLDVLAWLQHNADVAYGNRNSDNIIWTAWADKTQDRQAYDPWGASAAVALLFNCEQWW